MRPSKKELKKLYTDNKLTGQQIGDIYNRSSCWVYLLLKKYSIKRREPKRHNDIQDLSEQQLREYYLDKKMTLAEIGNLFNMSSNKVQRQLIELGIKRRKGGHCIGVPLSESTKKKLSQSNTGKKRSKETKLKISISKSGKNNPNFGKKHKSSGKRCWYVLSNGQIVSMRSQWEVWYAEYLKQNGIEFRYEETTFHLSDGSAYTPDFILNKTDEIIEVKGWFRPEHKEKLDRFKKEFPDKKLIIADKKYLENLGINLRRLWIASKPTFLCCQCNQPYHRNTPKQQFCSVKCRNLAIALGNTTPSKINSVKRKYNGIQSGVHNNSSKLTEKQVIEIRKLHNSGLSTCKISALTGVTAGNVSNIVNRKSWKILI